MTFPAILTTYVKVSESNTLFTKLRVYPDQCNLVWFTDRMYQEVLVLAHKESLCYTKDPKLQSKDKHLTLSRSGTTRVLCVFIKSPEIRHGVMIRNENVDGFTLSPNFIEVTGRPVIPYLKDFVTTEGYYQYYKLMPFQLHVYVDCYEMTSNKGVIEKHNSLEPHNKISDTDILSYFKPEDESEGESLDGELAPIEMQRHDAGSTVCTKNKASRKRKHNICYKQPKKPTSHATQKVITETFKSSNKRPKLTTSDTEDQEYHSNHEDLSNEDKNQVDTLLNGIDNLENFDEFEGGLNEGPMKLISTVETNDVGKDHYNEVGVASRASNSSIVVDELDSEEILEGIEDNSGMDRNGGGRSPPSGFDQVLNEINIYELTVDDPSNGNEDIESEGENTIQPLPAPVTNGTFADNDCCITEVDPLATATPSTVIISEAGSTGVRTIINSSDDNSMSCVTDALCDEIVKDGRPNTDSTFSLSTAVSSSKSKIVNSNGVQHRNVAKKSTRSAAKQLTRSNSIKKKNNSSVIELDKNQSKLKFSDRQINGEHPPCAPLGKSSSTTVTDKDSLAFSNRQLDKEHPPCVSPASDKWISRGKPKPSLKSKKKAPTKIKRPTFNTVKSSPLFSSAKSPASGNASNKSEVLVLSDDEEKENSVSNVCVKDKRNRSLVVSDSEPEEEDYSKLLEKHVQNVKDKRRTTTTRDCTSSSVDVHNIAPNDGLQLSPLTVESSDYDSAGTISSNPTSSPEIPYCETTEMSRKYQEFDSEQLDKFRQLLPDKKMCIKNKFQPFKSLEVIPENELVYWIALRRDTLIGVYRGKIPSNRHTMYYKGSNRTRSMLRNDGSCHNIVTDEQYQIITRSLNEIFCSKNEKMFDYMFAVLVPELIICLLMDFNNQSYTEAEEEMMGV